MQTLSRILFTSNLKPKGDFMPSVKLTLWKTALILGMLLTSICPTIAQTVFARTYGGNSTDYGFSVQQTNDSGYIIGGCTFPSGSSWPDFYLIKTNSMGDTLWTRAYGGTGDDEGYSVQQTTDSGYIISGITYSYGSGGSDVYLIKTNSLGDTLWTRTYGGTDEDGGRSVKQTDDGGYIIGGFTFSYGSGGSDVYLIKTNSLGDTLWTRTYGGTSFDEGHSIEQTNDGGYIIAGDRFVDVYLIKTNSLGDTLWTRTYGGVSTEHGYSVRETNDSGYIIVGWTASFAQGWSDVYLIKTNSMGDTLWTRTYGGAANEAGYSVQQTKDGGYIIGGWTSSFGVGNRDVYIIKTNSMGDTLWTRTYGGTDDDEGYSVQQTKDGGYIIGGYNDVSFGAQKYDVYLIKTDGNGLITNVSLNNLNVIPNEFILRQNYPNPFNPQTKISFSVPKESFITLKIYDLLGREVATLVQDKKQQGEYSVTWNADNVPSGVYFYKLLAGDFIQTKKMILMK